MSSPSRSLGLTVLLLLAVVCLDQVHGWGNRAQLNRRQRRQWPSSRYDVWQNDDDDGNDDDDDDNYGSSWKNRGSNARRMIQERRRQMKKYDNDDDDDDDDDDYPQARGRQRISPTISRFHRLRNRYYRNRNQAARRHEEPDDDYLEDRARARRHGAVWGRQQQQQQQGQQPGQQQQGKMNEYSDTQILSLYGRMKQYLSSRGLAS